jgi:hypothetical protein
VIYEGERERERERERECVCVCEESVRRQRERSIKYLVPWYHGTWYRRISLIQS